MHYTLLQTVLIVFSVLLLFLGSHLALPGEAFLLRSLLPESLLALVAFLLAMSEKSGLSTGLALTKPRIPKLALTIILVFAAVPAISLLGDFIARQLPGYEQHMKLLEELIGHQAAAGKPFLQLAIFALLPAFCEELFFRGWLVGSLAAKGLPPAVIIISSSAAFALFHLDPYRSMSTFLIGIILAILTLYGGSIIYSIVYHALNNSLVVLVSNLQPGMTEANAVEAERMTWFWVFLSLLAAIALLVHFTKTGITHPAFYRKPPPRNGLSDS